MRRSGTTWRSTAPVAACTCRRLVRGKCSTRREARAAPSSVLAYLAQAAEALTHLHSQNPPLIHGDVKPGNLILTRGGRIKLVDFGLSSTPYGLHRRSGTPGFRAPELAAQSAPSRASDIYALAATAFALLTGSPPTGILPPWTGINPAQAEQYRAYVDRAVERLLSTGE